jgi:glutamate-1-semialdehyde 2,1-aminomutase
MRTLAVIQARLGSKRFPQKVLEKLGALSIIRHIVSSVLQSSVEVVVLAVPFGEKQIFQDEVDLCLSGCEVIVVEGSENDVLSRFWSAAQYYQADVIVRVCGDNPFIMSEEINWSLERFEELPNRDTSILIVDGGYLEVFGYDLLQDLAKAGLSDYHREHVTSAITELTDLQARTFGWYIEHFHTKSVDTPQDLERLRTFYEFIS